ncbi:EAL domain-containing protein [Curvivirga sp.]|uniref:EAL domain-containing protein n=1 Tax=Curvivirga sp. TaxID=2856848 RepID=UPI003B59A285
MQQIFIIIGYLLLSLTLGIALPTFMATVSLGEGITVGILVAAVSGLVHENIHRRQIEATQARHLLLLKKAYDKTKLELLDIRNDMLVFDQEEKVDPISEEVAALPKSKPAIKRARPAAAISNTQEPAVSENVEVPSFLAGNHETPEEESYEEKYYEEDGIEEGEEEPHWLDALEAGEDSDFEDEGYEEEYDEEDELPQETEDERRQAMAKEVEVLQGLVDKLYSEGLPPQVKDRAVEEDSGDDIYEDGTPRIKPHVELDESLLPIVREALEAKRLDAHLQPIHTLPQRKRRFFEAFGRLRSKDGELLVPERIQMLMDEDGLNPTADTLLLYRCAQILKQNGGLEFDRAIFCNVSPATLSDVSFLRDFSEYMEKRRTLARSLVLELDHETIDPLLDDLREPMGRLAGIGLRFALDNVRDFNLDAMAMGRSHISYVKLDSPTVLALIKRIGDARFQHMKANLEKENIELIGNHIASERMLMDVMDLGIEYGQGILFGEAKPVKDPSSGLRIA